MLTTEEKKLELARSIAYTIASPAQQRAFAIVALFSGSEADLKLADSLVAANRMALIKVLLALGQEKRARNVEMGFSSEGEEKEKSESGLAIASFLIDEGRRKDARNIISGITNHELRAIALSRLAARQEEVIERMTEAGAKPQGG